MDETTRDLLADVKEIHEGMLRFLADAPALHTRLDALSRRLDELWAALERNRPLVG